MTDSILKGKKILAVDDEPDVLETLEEEIRTACPTCVVEKATDYEIAKKMITYLHYDVIILDIMGVRGFELLDEAIARNRKVMMLTAHALTPENLGKSFKMGAQAYLPKEKLGEIVPYIEDVLTHDYAPGWKAVFKRLKGFFDVKFGADWPNKTGIQKTWDMWG
jgi:DNA-binding response OmpR family regulator